MGKRMIGFNTQRNNPDFGGKFPGSCQCFSTAAWMFMSYYASDVYKYDDDKMLSTYVDDVSDIVGSAGIGEIIKRSVKGIVGNTAYWWQVHQAAIDKWLHLAGVKGKCIWKSNVSYAEILEIAMNKPVVCGTSKLAGLPGGHIILAVEDVIENGTPCISFNDPYGDARTFYRNQNGASVIYGPEFAKYFSGNILYWEEE